jgi:AMMECR1 domain-containing protein
LDEEAKKEALKIVKDTLQSFLTKGIIPKIKVKSKSLFKKLGCFVILKKMESFVVVLVRFNQISHFIR